MWVDVVDFRQALQAVEALVDRKEGGAVFTPNVDHVVKASRYAEFRQAYDRAALSFADGMPLIWVSRWLGCPLPERVAGSDLLRPLLERAAAKRWRVYVVGGAPGVAEVARRMIEDMGVNLVGWDDSRIGSDGSDPTGESFRRISEARPDLVFVALGPPKQEIWIDRAREAMHPAVAIGVGASFDFLIGKYARAPRWMGRAGLEWLYRLVQEPRRLWRRYLLEAPRFVGLVFQTWRLPQSDRLTTRRDLGSAPRD